MGRNYGARPHAFQDNDFLNLGAWCLFIGIVTAPALAVFAMIFFYLAMIG